MINILHWLGSVVGSTLTSFARFVFAAVLVLLAIFVVGLLRGDGLPGTMVLSLDLRDAPADSASREFAFGDKPATVMDIVLGLDAAGRDVRVKGAYVRLGSANLPIAQAEEIQAAFNRFRASGKFVIVHAQEFAGSGLGDYLAATGGDEIWMQPKSFFMASGAGGGKMFYRGLFDKIGAEPQIAKRAEYKSAADTYTATGMSAADREQTTALLKSWYDSAIAEAAKARKLDKPGLIAAFEASPQFSETAKKAGLIDKLGYDDDAKSAAIKRAGDEAKEVPIAEYAKGAREAAQISSAPRVALVQAVGEIVDGKSGGDPLGLHAASIGGDDIAAAIRDAAEDKKILAIVLRIDSPGGSVVASDQILDAVKKAQKVKPVVVSMGAVAASGGYYVSLSADKIVAHPGTVTGSIGVFTGKLAYGKTLEKIGIRTETIGIGKNALINSPYQPYTDEQWAKVNEQADMIYADFTGKVAVGRKMKLAKVQDIAKGRVWSGKDALDNGLVDRLGGFWTAVDAAKQLAKLAPAERVVFVTYPRPQGIWDTLSEWFGDASGAVRAMQGVATLIQAPFVRDAVAAAAGAVPRAAVELRAANLPR
jgi:protease IV